MELPESFLRGLRTAKLQCKVENCIEKMLKQAK
jgi:hypothetical protein